MNILCVIPARAESSRFFEKPLALIKGKPMLQWVYEHCREVEAFTDVVVATDSDRIKDAARSFGATVVMTSSRHDTATERLYEVSTKIDADLYVMVNGDEPLLTKEAIVQCIPPHIPAGEIYVSNLMTDFSNPVEVVDSTNLKIVTAADHRCPQPDSLSQRESGRDIPQIRRRRSVQPRSSGVLPHHAARAD